MLEIGGVDAVAGAQVGLVLVSVEAEDDRCGVAGEVVAASLVKVQNVREAEAVFYG